MNSPDPETRSEDPAQREAAHTERKDLRARVIVRRSSGFELDVRLDVEAGTTTALLGPNGAGKSTLIDALAGVLPIDDGYIALADRMLDAPADRIYVPPEDRRIGVVFQDYLLFRHLDVIGNIAFGMSGMRRRDARDEAGRWTALFDIVDLERRRPGELSGGQAQRVALARAMASEPDLLLLDEPLAALDVETRNSLRRTLHTRLDRFDGPRLLITHEPTDAFLLADRILVLEDGRITQAGSPTEIRRRPATSYVAALAGTNLLAGTNDHGTLTLRDRDMALTVADTHTEGDVLATIHPSAIALHAEPPHGSPRNGWRTSVAHIEPWGDVSRVTLGGPLALSADVTPAAVAALGLEAGSPVWVAIKATEIAVSPA